jgi:hypothetical protein
MHVYIGATKRRRRRTCNNALTSNDGVRAQVRCGGGVVHQVLDDEVAVGVDEGHEGGGIERLVVEVEGAEEGQRAGHQRPHPERAAVQPGHCK